MMTWYVVDGMDGSGKSTVGSELCRYLESKGRKVHMVTHPDTGKFIGRLEAKFLHTDMGKLTLALTTATYVGDIIGSLLRMRRLQGEYDDFIFVRYSMAAAYVPEPLCYTAYEIIIRILPIPDVKIFVDTDASIALSRIESRGEDREVFETSDKLKKARRKMLNIANRGWYILDNNGDYESTVSDLRRIVDGS